MKLRRLFCLLLASLLFICGVFSVSVYATSSEFLLYNDHLLRNIDLISSPYYPLSDYPYRFIFYRSSNDTYYLVMSVSPFYNDTSYVAGYNVPSLLFTGSSSSWSGPTWYDTGLRNLVSENFIWSNYDILYSSGSSSGSVFFHGSDPVDPNAPVCSNTDANCDNICDECGELLSMEYWSTDLEYLISAGYDIIDQTSADYFCILYNKNDLAPELIVGETKFEINSSGDILLTKNPQVYKLLEWENGSFSHYVYDDISKTADGLFLDPDHYIIRDSLRVLYSNHSVKNRYVYNSEYDPFGGGETRGGGADRQQAQRFDIDLDTYEPIGGLPADPEYGSGRVDVVVSPSAPPVSVPISPTSPVVTPTPDPVPVVTPTPDPSDPNSIIIQNQITNIGNDLAALPDKVGEKITDKIGDSIKGLFVPSETDIRAVKEKWSLLLSDRFGAVYESASVIDGIIDAFVYVGDMETITFPSVTVDLAGTPFTFGGWEVDVVPERFRFLTTTSKLITSIVCTVLFVNGMKKKLEGLLAR